LAWGLRGRGYEAHTNTATEKGIKGLEGRIKKKVKRKKALYCHSPAVYAPETPPHNERGVKG